MFNINPLENLKLYISSRPPLVVFMISVSAMAIAFLTLGYFFKIKEIKSPGMAEDWNTFLLRFNDLDLCVSENETLKHLTNDTTTPESTMTSGQARVSTQSPQTLEDSGPVNISVAITLTLDPLKPFGGYSRNVTHLYSTILGHQIGLSGREAHEEINITFTLPAAWSSDDCALHSHCEQVVFTACMTLTANPGVFPVTVQPPHCVPDTYSNATLWYKIFMTARDANTKYAQDYNPFWCYKGAIGKVYHTLNPKLTVIVPDDDRSLINLHLMHTSYFLFVMVITMFCYAVIKGRPSKLRQSSPEFCPEKVSQAGPVCHQGDLTQEHGSSSGILDWRSNERRVSYAAAVKTHLLTDFSLVICSKCTDEIFLLCNLTFRDIYKHRVGLQNFIKVLFPCEDRRES
ncbi:hypothetical protein MDA_GLEAN10017237 [Myotis davidii]|uniref:Transmembrane protein 248 n=1 Tax=Myotis davidii TaxID=225400 RepID=L5LF39_MYODS|nr:hypothetical protein MDA_GLEAN10017237 [Myotis davidii]